jgi:hypothetical protein
VQVLPAPDFFYQSFTFFIAPASSSIFLTYSQSLHLFFLWAFRGKSLILKTSRGLVCIFDSIILDS